MKLSIIIRKHYRYGFDESKNKMSEKKRPKYFVLKIHDRYSYDQILLHLTMQQSVSFMAKIN